jgi:hypothetical protein
VAERLTTWQGIGQLSWARAIILLVFLDSWLFLFTSAYSWAQSYRGFLFTRLIGGVLIFGAGLDSNRNTCSGGIYLCIVFYATSKALIYAFLSTYRFRSAAQVLLTLSSSGKSPHRLGFVDKFKSEKLANLSVLRVFAIGLRCYHYSPLCWPHCIFTT